MKGFQVFIPEDNRLRDAGGNLQEDQLGLWEVVLAGHQEPVQHGLMEMLRVGFPEIALQSRKFKGNGFYLAQDGLGVLFKLVDPALELKLPALLLQGSGDPLFKRPSRLFSFRPLAKDAMPVGTQLRAPSASSLLTSGKEGEAGELTD
jgi:hypothetical protein